MALLLLEADVRRVFADRPLLDVLREAVSIREGVVADSARGESRFYPRRVQVGYEHPGAAEGLAGWRLRILPALTRRFGAVGLKAFSGYTGTGDTRDNRQLSFAAGPGEVSLVYGMEAGMPLLAVVESYWLHGLSVAVPGGVAARCLARPDSHVLAVLGTGRHAGSLALAFCAVRPIRRVLVYSPRAAGREAFCRDLAPHLPGVTLEPANSAVAAVSQADIVSCATSSRSPVFPAGALRDGTHVSSIGRGEIGEDTIARVSLFVSVQGARFLVDGEIPPREPYDRMLRSGRLSPEAITDVGQVLVGDAAGRRSESEVTLFISTGRDTGTDVDIAAWAYRLARERNIGTDVPFGRDQVDVGRPASRDFGAPDDAAR